nr:MAG TPA: hypothetical protein [Caudoviricetes sp.]
MVVNSARRCRLRRLTVKVIATTRANNTVLSFNYIILY